MCNLKKAISAKSEEVENLRIKLKSESEASEKSKVENLSVINQLKNQLTEKSCEVEKLVQSQESVDESSNSQSSNKNSKKIQELEDIVTRSAEEMAFLKLEFKLVEIV